MSQTGATVDYDQFFSGLAWDADSQLYYARARWYDPTIGKYLAEDPLSFAGGDTNLSRYSLNDPVNRVDRNGLFSFKDVTNFVKDSFDVEKQFDRLSNNLEKVGNFFEKHWENGNIQKTLLVAGTIATGGMLASGALVGAAFWAGSLSFVSGGVNSYEALSGDQVGDGTFSRVLSASAAIGGGFFGAGMGVWGQTISIADGLTSGYEIATGRMIGDGTLSSVLHVGNLGVNRAGVFRDPKAGLTQRFTVGLNLAAGAASVASSGDPRLQQSLRSLSIAAGVWNTGTQVLYATHSVRVAAQTLKPTPPAPKRSRSVVQTGYQPEEQETQSEPEAKDNTNLSYDHLLYKPNAAGVAVYYVDAKTWWWDSEPEYIGQIDPETGYVRSPRLFDQDDPALTGGKVQYYRYTTLTELQQKTDEYVTDDWEGWWNEGGKDNGIRDTRPDLLKSSAGGLTARNAQMYRDAGQALTPAEFDSIRAGIAGTKMLAQAAMEFYATAPLELAGQMRTLQQLKSLRSSGVVGNVAVPWLRHASPSGFMGLEGLVSAKYPGAATNMTPQQFRSFEMEMETLGYTVKRHGNLTNSKGAILQGTTDTARKTVYINSKHASQQALVDEFAHVWNNVNGRGKYLDAVEAPMHMYTGEEALRRGTAGLSSVQNIRFHQMELKKFVQSGMERPGFFHGITDDHIKDFVQ